MLVIVGASASGKTEIANHLVNTYHYVKSVTTTTRDMRAYEQNHSHYHFISKETFHDLIEQDAFVETSEYQHALYGLQKSEVDTNKVVILDPNGCNAVLKMYPNDVCIVYIQSSKEIRQSRMLARGDTQAHIKKRLMSDDEVFHPSKLEMIHLTIDNHHQSIHHIAQKIHTFYEQFKKEKKI
jgi:guanylate kinase